MGLTQLPAGPAKRLAILAGGLSAILGLLVLYGWHTHHTGLLQVRASWIAMTYNTALLFVASGAGVVSQALGRARLARGLAAAVLALSLAILAQYVFGRDLGIDQLLMHAYITVKTAYPGRLAPNTALCFALVGGALLLGSRQGRAGARLAGAGVLGTIVMAVAANGLAGYLTGIQMAYDWGRVVPMAVHTAIGFLVLGAGVVSLAMQADRHEGAPGWVPLLVGVAIATLALIQWQALVTREDAQTERIVDQEATGLQVEIRRQLEFQAFAINRMGRRWGMSGAPPREEQKADAGLYVRQFAGVMTEIAWVDSSLRVRWRVGVEETGAAGGERSLLLGPSERAAVEMARDARQVRMARAGGRDVPELLIAVPVPEGEALGGSLLARYRVDRLIGDILRESADRGYVAAVYDGKELVYGRPPAGSALERHWGREKQIDLTGMRWRIRIWPVSGRALGVHSSLPIFTLVAGLLIAVSVSIAAHLAQAARRRAREAVEAQRERDRLFTLSSDLFCVAGTDGFLRRVNPAWSRILGYTEEELLSRPCLDFVHPDDRAATIAVDGELSTGLEIRSFENRYLCKDGSEKWLLWSCTPLLQEGLVYAVARDITDRKDWEHAIRESEERTRRFNKVLGREVAERTAALARANEELKQEIETRRQVETSLLEHTQALARSNAELETGERRFRALVENGSDALILMDGEGRIRYAQSTLRVLGYTDEEYVALNALHLVHPEDVERIQALLVSCLESPGVPMGFEDRARHKDGSWRHLEGFAVNRLHDPVVNAIIVNFRDVTERKRLEHQFRQAQRLEAVGRLAGGIAHDFNNILCVIISYGELLLEALPPDSPQREGIEEILKAADRAAGLTHQLLAFGRRQMVEPQIVDLNARIRDMEKMLSRLLGEDIELVTALAPDLGRIRMDPGQIEQVIMNLVVNARDAMANGGTLSLETRNIDLGAVHAEEGFAMRPGPYVMIAIRDTGTGIDQDTRAHLFEPFFTTKETGKGTGLGLATVYGIVKQNGGYVWVESEPGRGATFKVCVPSVKDSVECAENPVARAPGRVRAEKILLVEDEAMVRGLVRKTLEASGYAILEAQDPPDGLRIAETHEGPIHLMITDVIMPVMSGRTLADRLAHLRPAMKVLYMSGYADDVIAQHGVLETGIHFLHKPFTPDSLRRKVREILDGHGAGRNQARTGPTPEDA